MVGYSGISVGDLSWYSIVLSVIIFGDFVVDFSSLHTAFWGSFQALLALLILKTHATYASYTPLIHHAGDFEEHIDTDKWENLLGLLRRIKEPVEVLKYFSMGNRPHEQNVEALMPLQIRHQ
ncbi:hypothetical protein IF1G_06758 [Cordyceps javanica]|uniref:Uncharacterized protein n=1 Tax=Cordyceps javanica TaxID=43265 RepID=A0A545UZ64_9HYPO|nr:hypothetical protein IF1G_06758 [Cordyceps javanica]